MDLDVARATLPEFLTKPDPDIYKSANWVALDFETTNLDKGTALNDKNSLVLACWYGPKVGRHHVFGNEYDMQTLVEHVHSADFIVAHNAKFELQWLKRCGASIENLLVFDTQVAEYVIGGNRWLLHKLGLNKCAERHGLGSKDDLVSKLIKNGVCPSEIPTDWLLKYCDKDVDLCIDLFLSQREQLTDLNLWPVLYTRCLTTTVLADIEFNGMYIDADAVQREWAAKERQYAELEQKLEEMTGGINFNSGPQLSEYLYDTLGFDEVTDRRGQPIRTGKGARSTAAATLEQLKPKNAKQREFLELYRESRGLYSELTKYLRKFTDCCKERGGHLQAVFNQGTTSTHRLSSSGLIDRVQFQNFPRTYKRFFKARKDGWLVGEADGAQLEFRVAAHLGRDKAALHDIVNGTDIHSVTADIIGCSRQDAKAHTFKPLYGGKSGTKKEREYYQYFSDKYSGVTAAQRQWINEVLENKYLVTEWGMRYYWPDTRMDRSGYITNTTSICNYPVQAFATAEIIPIALVYFWHYLVRSEWRMLIVNTIHDSIIVELPEEEIEAFHALSERCFLREVYDYLRCIYNVEFTVPLATGVKVAERWGQTKEETVYTMEL